MTPAMRVSSLSTGSWQRSQAASAPELAVRGCSRRSISGCAPRARRSGSHQGALQRSIAASGSRPGSHAAALLAPPTSRQARPKQHSARRPRRPPRQARNCGAAQRRVATRLRFGPRQGGGGGRHRCQQRGRAADVARRAMRQPRRHIRPLRKHAAQEPPLDPSRLLPRLLSTKCVAAAALSPTLHAHLRLWPAASAVPVPKSRGAASGRVLARVLRLCCT